MAGLRLSCQYLTIMAFNFFKKKEDKTVPPVDQVSERTRDGLQKAVIPNFFYKPPYGYPRYVDLPTIRRLAATPFVEMCISTIIDEICAIPWNIVAEDENGNPVESKEKEVQHVKDFFENPNTNKESWDQIQRLFIRDVLEVDSGVLIKVFNAKEEMVEIVARDGITFTKNPDLHGMMTNREDFIFESISSGVDALGTTDPMNANQVLPSILNGPGLINPEDAREKAAYFQYGWVTGARPIPFGKREVVYFEKNCRTDNIYGKSPVENLADTIQTLVYAIEHNLSYFNENEIPQGVLALEGSTADEIKQFKKQWMEVQRQKDSAGNWKKVFHKLPIVGKIPKFEKFGYSNAELQLLEGQKWWAKIVWACYGVTPTELGYSDDAKGMANQIVQSNIFRKRAINPLLRMIEYKMNKEVISEFGYEGIKYKYKMFDVEEETKKANLYKLQTDIGLKTVNEVRAEEGLDEVEWGDDDPKRGQGNNINFGNPQEQEQADNDKRSKLQSRLKPEQEKPKPKKEEKELNSQEVLFPKEGEQMTGDKLNKSITVWMSKNEKKVKALLEKEMGQSKIVGIKAVEDLAKAVEVLVTFEGIKSLSDLMIKDLFEEGWEKSEKQLDRNLMINTGAVKFLQEYTFDNIKGMTKDVKDKLRQELQRGIINGESLTKLNERVTKVFDVGKTRGDMIARTESNRAENQGRLLAVKESGEDFVKQWSSHIDDRTSGICKRLNGQVVGINGKFKDSITGWEGTAPPSHVNCRSSAVYIPNEKK